MFICKVISWAAENNHKNQTTKKCEMSILCGDENKINNHVFINFENVTETELYDVYFQDKLRSHKLI